MIEDVADKFHARYSANSSKWFVRLDDVEIYVRNIIILAEPDVNLKQNFQLLNSTTGICFEIHGSCLVIMGGWIEKTTLWSELFDPDKPRSLAKTVTVK